MSLELNDITLTYPDGNSRITALDAVDFAVADGELIAVTGPSGSGKSSLLSVAGMLVTPDSGSVSIDGTTAVGLSEKERARMRRDHVGFVFQQDNLLPSLTALDQLLLTVDLRGGRPSRHRTAAMDLLQEVGLADAAHRRPHELSGGMRQRVNIARALMGSPSVLLIDEPTSALDSERGRSVVALISRLVRERGLAAVLVSHDLAVLTAGATAGIADTVWMADGAFGARARVSSTWG